MRISRSRLKPPLMFLGLILSGCVTGGSVAPGPMVAAREAEAAALEQERAAALERGEKVFTAFRNAYPGRLGEIDHRDGDVTITLDGVRFFWAGGRLLPESELPRLEEYTVQPFYRYPATLPEVPEYTPEMKTEMDERVAHLDRVPPARHSGIFTGLWRVSDARSADRLSRAIKFLKKGVRVHVTLVPILKKIEAEITARARRDKELARFVASLRSVSGLYWRKIARTETLSFHSFGAAVDIVAANPKKLETYWLWAKARDKEWYTRPLARRLMPPASFVEVFEKHGFVWGGKWLFYDTVHFEYRPEILLLAGFEVAP